MSNQSKMNLFLKPNLRTLGLTLSKQLHLNAYSDFWCYISIIWKASFQLQCEGVVEGVQWEQEGKRRARLAFPLNSALVQLYYFNSLVNYSSNNAIHISMCFKQKARFQNHVEPDILNNYKCFHLWHLKMLIYLEVSVQNLCRTKNI